MCLSFFIDGHPLLVSQEGTYDTQYSRCNQTCHCCLYAVCVKCVLILFWNKTWKNAFVAYFNVLMMHLKILHVTAYSHICAKDLGKTNMCYHEGHLNWHLWIIWLQQDKGHKKYQCQCSPTLYDIWSCAWQYLGLSSMVSRSPCYFLWYLTRHNLSNIPIVRRENAKC